MRLEHLTTAEILRTQSPGTDLERVLFERIQEALDDVISAQDEVVSCGHSMSELEQAADELETLKEEIESLAKHTKDEDLPAKLARLYEDYCR